MFLAEPLSPRQKVWMLSLARNSGLSSELLDELAEAIDLHPDIFLGIYNERPQYEDLHEILEDQLCSLRQLRRLKGPMTLKSLQAS